MVEEDEPERESAEEIEPKIALAGRAFGHARAEVAGVMRSE
jgi:hypothetical protein